MSNYANRLVDLPHFGKDRTLSSCLNVDKADEGLFFSILGNAREVKGGNSKITTRLSDQEVADVVFKLIKYLLGK